jgi:hypothetical protein
VAERGFTFVAKSTNNNYDKADFESQQRESGKNEIADSVRHR